MFTKKELFDLWDKHNFKPKKFLGQNFIIDKNIVSKLTDAMNISPNDIVLEIGPGFGQMTGAIYDKAKKVYVVEKDRLLAAILKDDAFKDDKKITVIEGDILKYDIPKECTKVVGNLPYYITTPIIEKVLLDSKALDMYFMVQKEYGARLIGKPGTKDYSSLTCFINYFCEVETIAAVTKDCFYPTPKVDSTFLRIKRLKIPRVKVSDEKLFFDIIHTCFQHRRKTVKASLSRFFDRVKKEDVQNILEEASIKPMARPEELAIEDFQRITNILGDGLRKG